MAEYRPFAPPSPRALDPSALWNSRRSLACYWYMSRTLSCSVDSSPLLQSLGTQCSSVTLYYCKYAPALIPSSLSQ